MQGYSDRPNWIEGHATGVEHAMVLLCRRCAAPAVLGRQEFACDWITSMETLKSSREVWLPHHVTRMQESDSKKNQEQQKKRGRPPLLLWQQGSRAPGPHAMAAMEESDAKKRCLCNLHPGRVTCRSPVQPG
jgi:hypothetical protein